MEPAWSKASLGKVETAPTLTIGTLAKLQNCWVCKLSNTKRVVALKYGYALQTSNVHQTLAITIRIVSKIKFTNSPKRNSFAIFKRSVSFFGKSKTRAQKTSPSKNEIPV